MSFFKKILGNDPIKPLNKIADQVEALEQSYAKLTDEELRGKTQQFKDRLKQGETLDDLLPEAFAAVREASVRTTGMKHFRVQVLGGIVLHQGRIAEMRTGEGKTLVATLPAYLNALEGKGVHIVTVNDYLARRDSEWMGPLYEFHGLSVDCIDRHQPNSPARRKAYMADITFGTNNEFGFDYLRDNMAISPKDLVQRQHNYAIVDEVDSVLIDDARTPLIISGPVPKGEDQLFEQLRPLVERLFEAQKKLATQYLADAKRLIASDDKKDQEEGFLALFRSHKALPKNKPLIKFLSEQGIKAGMLKTEEIYMEQNNKRMPEATDPLYFVIDEKQNSVDLTDKGIDLITGNAADPTLFVLPDITSQLSALENETDLTEEEKLAKKDELMTNYAIKSERVHTINQLLKAYAMFEKDDEYVVIDGQVKIVDEQTGRIMEGRRYSDGLHQAIEAKEGVKVEAATQTFATITLQNYFRMYHKLSGMTGTAETEAGELWDIYKLDVVVIPTNRPIARKDMNDRVYKTKREKMNAVVEDIIKSHEKGQPVLVGTITIEMSEELSAMLKKRGIKHNVLNAKFHEKEAEIISHAGEIGAVTIATNMAGRGTDIVLEDGVAELGGLKIIGTERHESRRIDNQLRGRAGRQGDPGESKFYLSLEDDLMRLFGSERMISIYNALGIPEGEEIQHKTISKTIEKAQKKIENNNFGIRKNLLDYDRVNNEQREVMYKERRRVLDGDDMKESVLGMMKETVANHVYQVISDELPPEEWDLAALNAELLPIVPLNKIVLTDAEKSSGKVDDLVARLQEETVALYEQKEKEFEDFDLREIERIILLKVIDRKWMDHIDDMDQLREGIGLQAYGQRDPVVEYRMAGFEMFNDMTKAIQEETTGALFHVQVEQKIEREEAPKITGTNKDAEVEKKPYVRKGAKVGRNDPCPCGSGKKYKNCCGRNK